jgi:hypothetical protein
MQRWLIHLSLFRKQRLTLQALIALVRMQTAVFLVLPG